ncbi:hypothetical protein FZEAL_10678 [Fusarium zealandicum]|uniref:Uncharacterized protein n=1 Tax=Fusarium zealandicum TaxID=1053134 RepID=A0A8H4TY21_9HYPO|nr:hypothetical protein FZEAL_10678 [Fusarium zealandicum]
MDATQRKGQIKNSRSGSGRSKQASKQASKWANGQMGSRGLEGQLQASNPGRRRLGVETKVGPGRCDAVDFLVELVAALPDRERRERGSLCPVAQRDDDEGQESKSKAKRQRDKGCDMQQLPNKRGYAMLVC